MTRSKTVIAGVVTAAALAIGGGALAATQTGPGAGEQPGLNDAAGEPAQEPAERMREGLGERGQPPHGRCGHHHRHKLIRGALATASSYLGLTGAELREALRDGRTLAELAVDEGKTVDGLVEAMVADATRHLNAAVASGRLTEQQKERILEGLPERIDALVQGELPPPPRGLGGGFDGPDADPAMAGTI